MLKFISIVVTFEVIAFPAHNLEIAIVKHQLRTAGFVDFVIEGDVMRMEVGLTSLIDDFLAFLV